MMDLMIMKNIPSVPIRLNMTPIMMDSKMAMKFNYISQIPYQAIQIMMAYLMVKKLPIKRIH